MEKVYGLPSKMSGGTSNEVLDGVWRVIMLVYG
jgi:hypothetical protein